MKRRLALLAVLGGMNVLLPVHAYDGGPCKACGSFEIEEQTYYMCVGNLEAGYTDCAGGFGTGIPCVNGAFSCPLEDG